MAVLIKNCYFLQLCTFGTLTVKACLVRIQLLVIGKFNGSKQPDHCHSLTKKYAEKSIKDASVAGGYPRSQYPHNRLARAQAGARFHFDKDD